MDFHDVVSDHDKAAQDKIEIYIDVDNRKDGRMLLELLKGEFLTGVANLLLMKFF